MTKVADEELRVEVTKRSPTAPSSLRRTKNVAPLKWAVRLTAVAVFFVAWQIYASGISPLLLVPPSAILAAAGHMIADGQLGTDTLLSLEAMVTGFGLALLISVPLGLVWARYRVVDWVIQPFVMAIFSTPLIALVPLYVLWFGFGFMAKVAIIGSFSFFPLLLNTYQGAISVDPMYRDVAKAFRATDRQTWRHVVLPSCIPYIAAGINISLGHALTGMIIAEFYTNASGLGGLVLNNADTFQTARMFVPIFVVMALGVLLMSSTRWLKRKIAPWAER
ncbi:MAG: ABC transporter permease [Acidobacteria bacterium]|nr:ABC transporter permease [Acidobacteriota bacterium]